MLSSVLERFSCVFVHICISMRLLLNICSFFLHSIEPYSWRCFVKKNAIKTCVVSKYQQSFIDMSSKFSLTVFSFFFKIYNLHFFLPVSREIIALHQQIPTLPPLYTQSPRVHSGQELFDTWQELFWWNGFKNINYLHF